MKHSRLIQTGAAVAACATVAAAIGIATGAAAPSKDDGDGNGVQAGPFLGLQGPPPGVAIARARLARKEGFPPRVLGGPPVHSEMVVPTRSGDGFITVTNDSGTVKSVSGDEVTIEEGTEEATYKTVSLEIPDDARVLRNGERVELGDLQEGDHVHVSQSPGHSFVFAVDDEFFDKAMSRLRDLPRPPRIGGLPPGLPVPMARRGNR